MPVYQYKAISRDGKTRTGTRESGSRDEIAASLKEEGLFISDNSRMYIADAGLSRIIVANLVSGE